MEGLEGPEGLEGLEWRGWREGWGFGTRTEPNRTASRSEPHLRASDVGAGWLEVC